MNQKPSKYFIINEIIKKIENNKDIKILDLGSGDSKNFEKIFERFPEINYTGIELSGISSKRAKGNYEVKKYPNVRILNKPAYLQDNNNLNEQFDLVVSLSVLEHVKDLNNFLKLSVDCLVRGGN